MKSENAVLSLGRKKGILLVLTAGVLWGTSANVAQYLFRTHDFNAGWLTVIRLLCAGLILLGLAYAREKEKIWGVWKSKEDIIGKLINVEVTAVKSSYIEGRINNGGKL